jgi:glycosyltransferase involved in cell wall biosynthesis
MKTILLTPSTLPKLTGNAVTVDRIAFQLSSAGITCKVVDLSKMSASRIQAAAQSFKPDIVHAFHAYKAGRVALKVSRKLDIPLITTMTGTDLYADIHSETKNPLIKGVLAGSQAITVFNEDAFSIVKNLQTPEDRIHIIHQSPFLPEAPLVNLRKEMMLDDKNVVFLLLGAVRRVKNYGLAIDVLKKMRLENPQVRLLIAGAIIEEDEFRRIRKKISTERWVIFLGEVPRVALRSLFHSVDALINASESESESNAVIEALSCGCIVIGRDIPGNRSLLRDDIGMIFRNEYELEKKIVHVVENRDRLDFLKARASDYIKKYFGFTLEKKSYIELYNSLM